MAFVHPSIRALFFASLAACGADHRAAGEYAALLAQESHRLILHAADDEPGKLRVWLTATNLDPHACPIFDLVGRVDDQVLHTLEAGRLIRISQGRFESIDYQCLLPKYELEYDPNEVRPEPLTLELGDDSLTFKAVVSAPAQSPTLQLPSRNVVAGGNLDCDVAPEVVPGGLSATLQDAAGTLHILNVIGNTGGHVSLRVPDLIAAGSATLELSNPNWIATRTESCEGPLRCQLTLRESLGGYAARSTARTAVEVR
jgi:hypothetical protein